MNLSKELHITDVWVDYFSPIAEKEIGKEGSEKLISMLKDNNVRVEANTLDVPRKFMVRGRGLKGDMLLCDTVDDIRRTVNTYL